MFWKQQIANLQAKIVFKKTEIHDSQISAQALFRHGKLNAKKIPEYYGNLLATNQQEILASIAQSNPEVVASWQAKKWQNWSVKPENNNSSIAHTQLIRIGDLIEERDNGYQPFIVPEFAPFIGSQKTIIICCSQHTRDLGLELLQSIVVRTALLLPHQIRYTLCDPASSGGAFLMRRSLPSGLVREMCGELYRDLLEVSQDIRRVKETYLSPEAPALHLLPPEIQLNERFEGIFAADFPKRYDRRDIEELQKIGNSGTDAGRYLFIHYNSDLPLPRDISIEGFENAHYIDLNNLSQTRNYCQFQFQPDSVPDASLQAELLDKVSRAKPPERKLNWNEIVGISEDQWWTQTSQEIIKTPIGGRGSNDSLNIWFGKDGAGKPCAHGMLGAMTGSGKSTLYHVFILGLAIRYSPAELRLYLIDGKQGVELAPYRHLPHSEVVSLHSSPELSRSILTELIEEKERRNSLFKSVGVNDFTSYRQQNNSSANLPRILLLVDEYQELFIGDKDDLASNQLLTLAQQGRSAGIHMLLASQGFGAAGMLKQTAIFGNIHLRMGMKMSHADIQALTEFGKRGKQLLMTCDLPGKIVLNDATGDESANSVGKVAFLEDRDRDYLVQKIVAKSQQLAIKKSTETVVFDGNNQPNLVENPQIKQILKHGKWLTSTEWEKKARQPISQGGIEVVDWFAAEHPIVLWLGQQFSVRKQAMMIMRRRPSENALIVGGDFHVARYGMLAAMLVSLAMNKEPKNIKFIVCDRSIPGTPWQLTLKNACDVLLRPSGFFTTFNQDSKNVGLILDNLMAELEQRLQLSEEDLINQPSLFLVMTELDRVEELRHKNDSYYSNESPLGEKLKRLYTEGASQGIHLILSFAGVNAMLKVIDGKRGLPNFRHRVALQMSEDDSFSFVRDRTASRLQLEGSVPIKALYADTDSDRSIQFKPYSTETTSFTDGLQEISNCLQQWSRSK